MTTATATKNNRTLIASGTALVPATPQRGVLDLRSAFGGLLTVKMLNGATGPTAQAVCNVLVAHTTGTTPAAASKGADWKTIATVGNGTTANAENEWSFVIDQAVMHLEVEFKDNTGQNVTVEAYFSEMTNIVNT